MSNVRESLILVAVALLVGCNDPDGHTGSTRMFDGRISLHDGQVTLSAKRAADASIDQTGHFSIDGHLVPTDAAQQALLLQYYQAVAAIREHGIATGKAGAAMAGEAIKGVAQGMASGDADAISQRVENQSKQIELAAAKICQDLSTIKHAQDALATQMPAFKPYADIASGDAEDCRNHD
jgi:hypothetical protein